MDGLVRVAMPGRFRDEPFQVADDERDAAQILRDQPCGAALERVEEGRDGRHGMSFRIV